MRRPPRRSSAAAGVDQRGHGAEAHEEDPGEVEGQPFDRGGDDRLEGPLQLVDVVQVDLAGEHHEGIGWDDVQLGEDGATVVVGRWVREHEDLRDGSSDDRPRGQGGP